jgi:hypothetical protein
MMPEPLDRLGARAATAMRELARTTADPDGDLAVVLGGGAGERPAPTANRVRWLAAAAVVGVAVAAVVAVAGGGEEPARIVPATAPPTPVTPVTPVTPATSLTSVPTTTIAAETTVGPPPSTTIPTGSATSPLEVLRPCAGLDCEDVRYGASGLPVVYDAAARTLTVLGATTRTLALDIPEIAGRLVAVGPDDVAYLAVESASEPSPGRLLAVPTSGERAGTVTVLAGPTDGLGLVGVGPSAGGIEVVDCCGVGVTDATYPYVDAATSPLPADPTRERWSWTWTDVVSVVDRGSGRTYEVPQPQAEREGPRAGDVRPLLDGRVPVLITDEVGAVTIWLLDPSSGAWTSTALGDVNVVDIDPAGAVLVRDRSTLAPSLVPLV